MKRRIILFLCYCLILSSCMMPNSTPNPVIHASAVIKLAISKELDGISVDCEKVFIDEVLRASKNTLTVEVIKTDFPLDSLDIGQATVAIMGNSIASMANGDFLAYTSPFYFENYKHFTMTFGSEDFHNITNEKNASLLGATPIGAMYAGSYVIATGKPDPLIEPASFNDGKVTLLEGDELLFYFIEGLGSKVTQKSIGDISDGFAINSMPIVEYPKNMIGTIPLPRRIDKISVSDSFHRVDINWIMMSESADTTLSDFHKSAIHEGVAAVIAYNDNYVLKLEEDAQQQARLIPASIEPPNYTNFTESAEEYLRKSIKYANIWNWEVYSYVKGIVESY